MFYSKLEIYFKTMNEIINQINELKQMQKFPRYHLSKYFDELKAQVDTKYSLKLDEKEKYLKITSNIESFEQTAYNKWKSKSINTYDTEINSIEGKFNNNLTDITKLIDEVKFKIEKMLFSNKSILFIEKTNFDFVSNLFLLIINDEYIPTKNCIINDFDQKLVTRNELNDFILKGKLKKINLNSTNVINLDIDMINLEKFYFFCEYIKDIHLDAFNGLVNLKAIMFNK
jgi:hypothetical protein